MTIKTNGWRRSRRRFIHDLLRGAGLGIFAAGAGGCDPGSYVDYLTMEEGGKVDDRFDDSMSGNVRQPNFPVAASDKFSFLWTSDVHITSGEKDLMSELGVYANHVDAVFMLHSGDCVDQGNSGAYEKWARLTDLLFPVPVFSAVGNHDIYNDGWHRFKKFVGPSVFRFMYGPCDFIFIDSAAGTLGRDQMHWLEKTLESGGPAHRFVLGHYPIYDGAFQTPASMGNVEETMMLVSLFDENNVSYFLCGHKHTGAEYDIRGVRHIIAGAGSGWKQILDDDYHFWHFEVDGYNVYKTKVYFSDIEAG